MKQINNDYSLVVKILSEVEAGKNLTEMFALYTGNAALSINLHKVKDLCYGVLRSYFSLAMSFAYLAPKKAAQKQTKVILLIGLYEIENNRKPEYAIVSNLVNLTHTLTKSLSQKKFVNAVLRTYLRTKTDIKAKLMVSQEYRLNFPLWWIKKLNHSYGVGTAEAIMHDLNLKPSFGLRVNLRKVTLAEYIQKLRDTGIEFKLIDNKFIVIKSMAVSNIPGFSDGYVSIQDIHAQKLIDLVKLSEQSYVLDACCAPGGKTCQILENYNVDLVANDISKDRLDKVKQNLKRLDLIARIIQFDAAKLVLPDSRLFDVIIADVPCSASGTVRRNPDIKLQRLPADISNFVSTQRTIIQNLWLLLNPGGEMIYITCSIFYEENQGNIQYFKEQLVNCMIITQLSLLPTPDADGFYYCVLKKVKNEVI